jgi:hypothetical protein
MARRDVIKYLADQLAWFSGLSGLSHLRVSPTQGAVTASQEEAMVSVRFLAAAAAAASLGAALDPAAVYDGGYGDGGPILLGVGNGGAGQSGLIKGALDRCQQLDEELT